jgi:hypothetical protein
MYEMKKNENKIAVLSSHIFSCTQRGLGVTYIKTF